MTMNTKKEVFKEHLERYLKASKEEKGKILDHLAGILGLHRKSVIRTLRREQMRDPWREYGADTGSPIIYGQDVTAALKEVWEISNYLCAERLQPVLNDYIDILIRDTMWSHRDDTTAKLYAMSLATMKRRIANFQKILLGGGRSTTKPSNLKEIIQIRRGPWENPLPGFGEIDTVVHCGATLCGDMAYSVNFTDISTGWTESAAQLNKGQQRTKESIQNIRGRLPFPMLGLDPDSGSEFVNWVLKEWCDLEKIELTRSRPNHKNDNAHIEQKNYTAVRKFLGYNRIDAQEAIDLMNKLYAGPLRLYLNFFQPSMKCVEKIRKGSKYTRSYDTPQTPYARVLNDPRIDNKIKETLRTQYATLNPKRLKQGIDNLIKQIFETQKRLRNAPTPR